MTLRRWLEIVPGSLVWLTFILMIVGSIYFPVYVAIFIIIFDIYWFLKTLILSAYLGHTFRIMKKNMEIDWLGRVKDLDGWSDIYHLVLFPMYDEPYEVVKETFEKLLKANYPLDKLIVVLGTEERAGQDAAEVGRRIREEFGPKFHTLLVTDHPKNLEGEIPGKGSNQAWMAKEAQNEVIDKAGIDYGKILVSVFDVDTQIYKEYFGKLTEAYLTAEDRDRASYQPIPLFNNNILEAPAFARVVSFSASLWQMIQQARQEQLTTFSSHAMPFKALVEIGFWHKDIVSEDSRIFWQLFTHYDGHWRVVPLHYPVSMDANVVPSFWKTMVNIYKQQRRWAWGSENISFLVSSFIKNKKIALRKKLFWSFYTIESFHSWATNSILIFALGWLPLFLGGDAFNESLLSFNLPRVTQNILSFASIGIAVSAILGIILLPPKPKWFKWYHYFLYLAQWILLP
ncbi:MAG: hypothetical protein COT88_01990, partial [Candidatus Colwellbacteria bacterium CG10_big_fil_rev_8_21_14_0_10_41_28]